MKICPVLPNVGNYQINNKKYNSASYIRYNSGVDSVSFGAKIPDSINAELKYKPLTEKVDRWGGTGLRSSHDERILNLLYDLRYDEKVSDDFKSKLLLGDNNAEFESRIQNAGDDENDFNFRVAKAMIEASPNVETTKKQLLTERARSSYASPQIPLEVAGPKAAKMLLEASPDEETLRSQLYHKRRGVIPFEEKNEAKKIAMLQALSYDMQREMLLNPRVVFNGEIQTLQRIAPDDKTRSDILQVRSGGGSCLLHGCTKGDAELVLDQIKNQPEKVKAMLLEENSGGNIPIVTSSLDAADVLLNASPDDETLARQLTAKNRDGLTILARAANKTDNPYEKPKTRIHYLMLSPDDETLMTQLFSNYDTYYKNPVADNLYEGDFIKVLNKLQSPEAKKAFLNKTWTRRTKYNDIWNNWKKETASMPKLICERIGDNTNREELGNILLDVVRDDTTTNEEALQLIQNYRPCLTPATREYFDKIHSYLSEQGQAE